MVLGQIENVPLNLSRLHIEPEAEAAIASRFFNKRDIIQTLQSCRNHQQWILTLIMTSYKNLQMVNRWISKSLNCRDRVVTNFTQ